MMNMSKKCPKPEKVLSKKGKNVDKDHCVHKERGLARKKQFKDMACGYKSRN